MGKRFAVATVHLLMALCAWGVFCPLTASPLMIQPLKDTGDVAVFELEGGYDAVFTDGSVNDLPRREVAASFYGSRPDRYDFLVIFSNFDFAMPGDETRAFYLGVKNDVRGIGLELFDNSGLFGSGGALQGTIDMGNIRTLATDPLDPAFSETLGILSHELLHRWGAHVKFKDGDAESGALLGRDNDHWSFLLDTAGSLLYGNRWVENGDNTFTALQGRRYISPLDLYLMGLLEPEQVPPMLLIDNPDIDPARLPEAGVTITGSPRRVTIDQVIAAEGERVPGVADTQKSFRVGCLLLVRPGTFVESDLDRVRAVMSRWPTWFTGLTDGRAQLVIDRDPFLDIPGNPGPTIPPPDPRTAPPEVTEGVSWLLASQGADGSWQDGTLTAERDTVAALQALAGFPEAAEAFDRGLSWLEATAASNLDFLARKIDLLAGQGLNTAAAVEKLLERQHADGGWGSDRAYGSSPLDTAWVVRALASAQSLPPESAESAVRFLQDAQHADGGWGVEEQSDASATASVVAALLPLAGEYHLEEAVQRGLNLLETLRDGEGGYGRGTVYETAETLLTLKRTGIGPASMQQSLDFLLSLQRADGSWEQSVYQTALAVLAVRVATRDPDLVVGTEGIVFSPAGISTLPTEATVTVTVRNTGTTDVPEARIVLYEGAVSPGAIVGEATLSLPGGGEAAASFPVTIARGTAHYFYAVIDPDNLVAESSEDNNAALRILSPKATYDFGVDAGSMTVTPGAGSVLEPVTVSARVRNTGTVDAHNVPVQLVVDNGSGPLVVATRSLELPAGEAVDAALEWTPSFAGQGIALSLVLDPHRNFAETDESNNTVTVSYDVNGSTRPDLALAWSEITFEPVPALEGGDALLHARVTNRGFADVTGVRVEMFDGEPGQPGAMMIGSAEIPSLMPGESAEAVVEWTGISVSGERVIYVLVDPQDAIDEIDEANNSGFATLRVLSLPDFVLHDTALSFSPESPREGDPVTVSAMVMNRGGQSATFVPVTLYAGGVPFATRVIPELPAGGRETVQATLETGGRNGIIRVAAVVDPEGTVPEQDRGNNRGERALGVQDTDLWLSNRFISPNGDGIKDFTDFGFRMSVPGDVSVQVANAKEEVVRTYDGPDFENTAYVALTWDGRDDRGRVVEDGEYRIRVVSAAGALLAHLPVTVDTNRSSLLAALGTPYLYETVIDDLLGDNNYNWLPDDSGVVFHLKTKKPQRPEFETGIYYLSPVNGDILRLVPQEWNADTDPAVGYRYLANASDCNTAAWMLNECDQVNPGFALAGDSVTIFFILEKYDKSTGAVLQQQLWTVDRFGEKLALLESYDHQQGDTIRITDLFPSPDGAHVAYKLYDPVTERHFFAVIGTDGSGRTSFEPGWTGFDDQHRLTWAPDGRKLVFSNATHGVVANLAGETREILPIENPTVFFNWHGSDRILARDVDTTSWEVDSWVVDLRGMEPPLLLQENLELPTGWYEFGSCLKRGAYSVSVPPLLGNGDFIAGYAWQKGYISNYIVCNIDGECKDAELYEFGFANPSLTPDGEKILTVGYLGSISRFNFAENLYSIILSGYYYCVDYWDPYSIPDNYSIIFPSDHDCNDHSIIIVPSWDWFDDETILATYSGITEENVVSLNITNEERNIIVNGLDSYGFSLSPDKKYLGYQKNYNAREKTYKQFHILSSLLNLTASLQPFKSETAVSLRGIAADLNFAHWQLEYTDRQTPDDWHVITPPVEQPVVNGLLATWIPPHEGSFVVRLTVTDRAGNTTWDRRTVTWGKRFSVTGIYKSGELFSPNGDGVKDTVALHYTVRNPVHLEFSVHDESGLLVRTFQRDHATPGAYEIVWDGRDEAGGIVPDGYYSIRLFDYEFFFQVDTTPPETRLVFDQVSCGENDLPPLPNTLLSGLALDANLAAWNIDSISIGNPDARVPFTSGTMPLAVLDNQGAAQRDETGSAIPSAIQTFNSETRLSLGFLGGKTFRITAGDAAGNTAVSETQFPEEMVLLSTWDEMRISLRDTELPGVCETAGPLAVSHLAPGVHQLGITETIGTPIRSATVQYRRAMQWRDAEQLSAPVDGQFTLPFDTTGLDPDGIAAVRVLLRTESGLDMFSNVVPVGLSVFHAEPGCIGEGSLSPPLARLRVSLPESLTTVQLQARRTGGGGVFETVAEFPVFDGHPLQFPQPLPEGLPPGLTYPLRFVGIGESGRVYVSNELSSPPGRCSSPGTGDIFGEKCEMDLSITL